MPLPKGTADAIIKADLEANADERWEEMMGDDDEALMTQGPEDNPYVDEGEEPGGVLPQDILGRLIASRRDRMPDDSVDPTGVMRRYRRFADPERHRSGRPWLMGEGTPWLCEVLDMTDPADRQLFDKLTSIDDDDDGAKALVKERAARREAALFEDDITEEIDPEEAARRRALVRAASSRLVKKRLARSREALFSDDHDAIREGRLQYAEMYLGMPVDEYIKGLAKVSQRLATETYGKILDGTWKPTEEMRDDYDLRVAQASLGDCSLEDFQRPEEKQEMNPAEFRALVQDKLLEFGLF